MVTSRMPKLPSRKRILQLKAATEANITDVGAKVPVGEMCRDVATRLEKVGASCNNFSTYICDVGFCCSFEL